MGFDAFKDTVTRLFPWLEARQLEQLQAMEPLYREWNAKINVISRKDMDGFYEHHVLHSLAIALYLQHGDTAPDWAQTVLDLGTGGGFPGIPLAILFPQVQFTLCDSIAKKIRVAASVAEALGLDNVTPVNARAETLPGVFDCVVSRAVTDLENFYPWVKDRFRGSIYYLKGGDVNEEIARTMGRFHLRPGSVHTWRIDSVLGGEYFAEKFVIHFEKAYLCAPK